MSLTSTAPTTSPTAPTPPLARGHDDAPGLRLSSLTKNLGGRRVVDDLDLDVGPGELLCLLGPSGCGKTTTLRMIGGFLTPDAGYLEIAGRDVTALPPERRPTAMVFQNYALWPHMSVAANVGFGLRVARVPRREAARRVAEALEMVNLSHHATSYPARISGGEQQRAALARAMVLRPDVLLLDEPLSNLDARLRVKVREDIRAIQQATGTTTVLVTHDQDEALSVSDRIAVMNGGRIEQLSTPRELYRRPRTRFVAEFIGSMNLLDVEPGGRGCVRLSGPGGPLDVPVDGDVLVPAGGGEAGPLTIGVRPEDVRIAPAAMSGPHDAPGWRGAPARIVREVPRGSLTELVLDLAGQRVRATVPGDLDVAAAHPRGEVAVRLARVLAYHGDDLLAP